MPVPINSKALAFLLIALIHSILFVVFTITDKQNHVLVVEISTKSLNIDVLIKSSTDMK